MNLGLNDKTVAGLARRTNNPRFAWDAYRRFVQMYASVVTGLPKEELEGRLRALKERLKTKDDTTALMLAAGLGRYLAESRVTEPQALEAVQKLGKG